MQAAADVEGERAGLDGEPGRVLLDVPAAELLQTDPEADRHRLASADGTAGERDQAADRRGYGRHEVPQIDLDDLVAVAATGTPRPEARSATPPPANDWPCSIRRPGRRGSSSIPSWPSPLPAGLVSSAALNAFSMAVECLQGGLDDPLTDALLIDALRELPSWLSRAQGVPDDPQPRMRLMLAALLCGQSSDYVGGGLAQALSHAAGPRSSVANGVVEALLLPYTMRFTAAAAVGSLDPVAQALGCPPGEATDERPSPRSRASRRR